MPTPISTILRAATRSSGEPLNILCMPTHERYESHLVQTGHNFFAFRGGQGIKDWNPNYAEVPPNYTLLNTSEGEEQLPPDVVFDVVLSQHKFGQFQVAKRIANRLNIPMVSLEHTLPHPNWGRGPLTKLKHMMGQINVFISQHAAEQWGWGQEECRVIEHGIDTDRFKPDPSIYRKPHCLSVVNDWIKRDIFCGFHFWKKVTEGLPCFVVGDNPGLSLPSSSLDELIWRYQQSMIFVSTAVISPIPTTVLEAMACGCAVVTAENPMIATVIEDGVNGYITNDPQRMRLILEKLLEDPDECHRLGKAARQTVVNRYSLPRFLLEWKEVFREASEIVLYT